MFKPENIRTKEQLESERIKNLSAQVRMERDRLLAETDYLTMPDYPLKNVSDITAYRQALRDITDQPDFPEYVTFPEMPEIK